MEIAKSKQIRIIDAVVRKANCLKPNGVPDWSNCVLKVEYAIDGVDENSYLHSTRGPYAIGQIVKIRKSKIKDVYEIVNHKNATSASEKDLVKIREEKNEQYNKKKKDSAGYKQILDLVNIPSSQTDHIVDQFVKRFNNFGFYKYVIILLGVLLFLFVLFRIKKFLKRHVPSGHIP